MILILLQIVFGLARLKNLNREIRSALADYLPKRYAQNEKNIHALFISQRGTCLSPRAIAYRLDYWIKCAGICCGVSAKKSTFDFFDTFIQCMA